MKKPQNVNKIFKGTRSSVGAAPAALGKSTVSATGPSRATATPGSTSAATAAAPAIPSATSAPNPTSTGPNLNVSSYSPTNGQPDPRDATYWANLAKLQSSTQQDYAAAQLDQTQSDVNFNSTLANMGESRRRGVRDMAESLIGSGLLRSGAHNRRQTEATADYLSQLGGVQSAKTQEDQKRQATMGAILSSLGVEEQGLFADAAGRYAQGQADAASQQTPTAPVTYAPVQTPKKKKKKK